MRRCLAAIGCGTVLGVAVAFVAFRISEHFDAQLVPF